MSQLSCCMQVQTWSVWPTHIWHALSTSSQSYSGVWQESKPFFPSFFLLNTAFIFSFFICLLQTSPIFSMFLVQRTRLIYCCFWCGVEKTRDVFKPSGTLQPQVSAGLSMLESVLLKSGKRERPHSSSNPLKCCFCDRSTRPIQWNPEEQTLAPVLRGKA